MSDDGIFVAFNTSSDNLIVNDTNGNEDVFINSYKVILPPAPYINDPYNGQYFNTGSIEIDGSGIINAPIRVWLDSNLTFS